MLIAAGAENLMLWSSLLLGLAGAVLAGTAAHVLSEPRRSGANDFERQRRRRLREADTMFRWLEPLVEEVAAIHRAAQPELLSRIRWRLDFLPGSLPYKPEEFLAITSIGAGLLGAGLFLLGFVIGFLPAAVCACVAAVGYQQLAVSNLRDKCRRRLRQFKIRLPFALDMMALMMSAGATFQESLDAVVKENQEHPIGQDFGLVGRELSLGRTRQDALHDLDRRLDDDDVRELVFAVVKGEELGTPLSRILVNQAEQLRLKRSQWAEKAAGEAQVKMVYPGMLIMIACLIITVAPFLMKFIEFF